MSATPDNDLSSQPAEPATTSRKPRSIGARITLQMTLLLGLLIIVSIWVVERQLLQGFEEAELSIAGQNQVLAAEAMQRLPLRLNAQVKDWATWDDSYDFVQQPNEAFIESNLGTSTLETLDVTLLLYLDTAGRLVWGRTRAPGIDELAPPDEMMRDLSANDGALLRAVREAPKGGLVRTTKGVVFLTAHPILHSDQSGPEAGWLIFGRLLGADWKADVAAIIGQGNASLEVYQPALETLPAQAGAVLAHMRDSGEMLVTRSDRRTLHTYVVYRDLLGAPALLMDIRIPRRIRAYGMSVAWTLTGMLVGVQFIGMLLLWLLIQRLVGQPVRQLSAYVQALDIADPASHRAPLRGNDEFSALAGEFETLITRQRADETQLRKLAAALEHATESVMIMDPRGIILYVNATYVENAGRPRKQILGTVPQGTTETEAGYAARMEMMNQVTAEKKPWHGVLQSRKPDGTIRIEEATVSPILKTDNELDGFVIIKRDITERLALESQLAQAQKLESIGQLAAGIAHEINTPAQYVGDNIRFVRDSFTEMNALLGALQQLATSGEPLARTLTETLQKADLDFLREEIPKALEQSADGCQRISSIVKAMKEFSHPGADKTPVDLNRAIQSTITVATNEWKYVAEIRTEFDPALPHVTCLPGEFNQVILNMLVNAAHAITDVVGDGARGKGVITVTTRQVGEFAEIRISDTGCGITPEIREKIFDPFFTTKQVGKGTGQGLAIAHDVIVNKHGGTIGLESEPGKGSTFIIKIPVNPVQTQAVKAA